MALPAGTGERLILPEQLCGRAGKGSAPSRGGQAAMSLCHGQQCQSRAPRAPPVLSQAKGTSSLGEEWAQQLLGCQGHGGAVPGLLQLLPMGHHPQGCPLPTNLKLCTWLIGSWPG